jgi:cohesin complex subunit SA-1/2
MDIDNPPLSSPGGPSSTPAEDRRKSGRQTRRPEVFSQTAYSAEEQAAGGKRKRGEAREDGDEDVSESDNDDIGDDETDEEELKGKRRAAHRTGANKPKSKPKTKGSHASKKPKVASNGLGRQLAFRPATNGRLPAARPRKPKVRPSLASGERGLFGES